MLRLTRRAMETGSIDVYRRDLITAPLLDPTIRVNRAKESWSTRYLDSVCRWHAGTGVEQMGWKSPGSKLFIREPSDRLSL
jgi:hypothetical protein